VRLADRTVVMSAVALSVSLTASEALATPGTVLVFAPTNPKPGRTVVVTAQPAGGQMSCSPAPRCGHGFGGPVIPIANFGGPARVYLVPNAIAPQIRSATDPRLIPIGTLRNGRLVFTAAKLENTVYAAVVSCPVCAFATRGRTLFVIGVGADFNGLTPLMLLRPHGFESANGHPLSPWVIGLIAAGALLALLATGLFIRRRRPRRPEGLSRSGTATAR
jgi:hypothetical protein